MNLKNYEGMFLVDTKELKKGAGSVEAQINALIEKCRGKVIRTEKWDDRKLAYDIKGSTNGSYFLYYFSGEQETVKLLNRECELSSLVLRALFLNITDIPEPRGPDWRREREESEGDRYRPSRRIERAAGESEGEESAPVGEEPAGEEAPEEETA